MLRWRRKSLITAEVQSDLEFVADEVRRLRTEWDCFEQLFLSSGRTVLQSHAAHLLDVVRVALATDMVMTICRLCDPPRTSNKPNLVFESFLSNHPQRTAKSQLAFSRLKSLYSAEIRPVRHKRLAHNGLLLLRGNESINAPKVAAIRGAVELCDEVVGSLYSELTNVAISFTPSFVPGEVDWIEAALRLVDEDRIKIKQHHEAVRNERTK